MKKRAADNYIKNKVTGEKNKGIANRKCPV